MMDVAVSPVFSNRENSIAHFCVVIYWFINLVNYYCTQQYSTNSEWQWWSTYQVLPANGRVGVDPFLLSAGTHLWLCCHVALSCFLWPRVITLLETATLC